MQLNTWNTWGLLNSINRFLKIETLVNKKYLQWNSIDNKVIISDVLNLPFSYLTNNEVKYLSEFLEWYNTDVSANYYYQTYKNTEILIINNIYNWLNNPSFFLNVTENINNFLICSNSPLYFDGNNLLFHGKKFIIVLIKLNISISNEFTFQNNTIYKSTNNFNKIEIELYNWINKLVIGINTE
jgi:hypothetical protein